MKAGVADPSVKSREGRPHSTESSTKGRAVENIAKDAGRENPRGPQLEKEAAQRKGARTDLASKSTAGSGDAAENLAKEAKVGVHTARQALDVAKHAKDIVSDVVGREGAAAPSGEDREGAQAETEIELSRGSLNKRSEH